MITSHHLVFGSKQGYRFLLGEVPNASRAHSVFRLSSSYAGACIFASDTLLDIGFANNLIDTSAITAVSDSAQIWYDQTLNANATTVAGRRPDIKTSGVIQTLNGIPAFNFNPATSDYIQGGGNIFRNTGYGLIAMVLNRDANTASLASCISVATSTSTRAAIQYRNSLAGNEGLSVAGRRLTANSLQAVGTSAYSSNQIIVCAFFDWANAELTIWENNVMTGNLIPFQTTGVTENNAGAWYLGTNVNFSSFFLNGHIQEVVIWEGSNAQNAAANVSTIFDNINSRYNTY